MPQDVAGHFEAELKRTQAVDMEPKPKRQSNVVTSSLVKQVLKEEHNSPFIKLLLKAMEDIGCPVSPSMHIVVEKCHGTFDGYGGFDSENNEIVLCEEKFASLASPTAKRKMDMILSHELVHAYDHCRSNVDFYDDAGHSMCTEVRAAALSGQCMLRYNIPPAVLGGFKKHHQKCVRSHAMNSFKTLHPTWSTKKSSHLLDQVFKPCYNDTEPFDRVPLTKNQADLSYKAYVTRNRYRV